MNKPFLEPYNYYVLYASLILLIIFLIVTAVKAAGLMKSVSRMKETMKPVNDQITLVKIKKEAMEETKAENKKKNRIASVVIPFLLYAYQLYKKDDELHGLKGYRKAMSKAAASRKEEKRIIQKVKADL